MSAHRLATVAVIAAFALSACGSESADPVAVIESYYAAFDTGDRDAARAVFAEDVEIRTPSGVYTGATGVIAFVAEGFSFYQDAELANFHVDGSRVTWDDTFYTKDGDIFHTSWEAVIEDGRIKNLVWLSGS